MSPRAVLTVSAVGALLVEALALMRPPLVLVWNATPSAPVGLYRIESVHALGRGELIALRPPAPLASQLAAAGYLPRGVPLLKHLAATEGDLVCRVGTQISIDGRAVATALPRDRRGRRLPTWSGCFRLAGDQLFVLNPAVPDSLDSRYFGALPTSAVVGRARPLWPPAVR